MKKAFSRLITFINHLLAYAVSTLVERWMRKHLSGYVIVRDDEVIAYNCVGDMCVLIDDHTGTIEIGRSRRSSHENKEN